MTILKNNQKIVLITGSYPPNYCGVGDYTCKLFKYLKAKAINIDLAFKSDWSLKYYFKYLRELFKAKGDVYHFQYPTEGYSYSMLPLLLLISLITKKTIVTVHELSSRNRFAYIYTQLLIFFSNRIIVSNSLEKQHACRFIFNSSKVSVIPIASNIQKSNFSEVVFNKRSIDLAYFGHIRPLKGIENFMNVVSLLKSKFDIQLIGQTLENYRNYFEETKAEAERLDVKLIINKDEGEVADILSNVKVIYLPFPDGISNRRGTLLACILNGCVVVSIKSKIEEFNIFFQKYCYLVDSDKEAVEIIQKLLKGDLLPKDLSQIKHEFSWDNVISKHLDLYNTFN